MSSKRENDPLVIHEYRKIVAQQIAAEVWDMAMRNEPRWEDYPDLGEYDWEAIVDMVTEKGPAWTNDDERARAWKGLTENE